MGQVSTEAATSNTMFARFGTDYEIRNQWFFAILKAMTTDCHLSQWKCNDRLQQAMNFMNYRFGSDFIRRNEVKA